MDLQEDTAEGTLAGRRHQQLPLLGDSDGLSSHSDSADESGLRNGKLRVVNETRQRLDSDGSILVDRQSPSTMPGNWSANDFREDQDRKARWRESTDIRQVQVPASLHDQTVDILIMLRLLPVMKSLQDHNDRGGLKEALRRSEAILDFAVNEDASPALQGRCCYYIGVAMFLLEDDEAAQFFIGALDARTVYEEGEWAKQWMNHYDSIGELSPNRIAETDRRVSWGSDIGYWRDHGVDKSKSAGSRISHSHKRALPGNGKGEEIWKPLAAGIRPTTPVSKRFSLDIRDETSQNGALGSASPESKAGSSIYGGESIPSFSSWDSSSSSRRKDSTRSVPTTDGLHSPKSAAVSSTKEPGERGEEEGPGADIDAPQPSPELLKSSTVIPAALRSSRPQPSRFRVNPPSTLERIGELLIDPTYSTEHHVQRAPPAPDAESEQEFY